MMTMILPSTHSSSNIIRVSSSLRTISSSLLNRKWLFDYYDGRCRCSCSRTRYHYCIGAGRVQQQRIDVAPHLSSALSTTTTTTTTTTNQWTHPKTITTGIRNHYAYNNATTRMISSTTAASTTTSAVSVVVELPLQHRTTSATVVQSSSSPSSSSSLLLIRQNRNRNYFQKTKEQQCGTGTTIKTNHYATSSLSHPSSSSATSTTTSTFGTAATTTSSMEAIRQQILQKSLENIKVYGITNQDAIASATIDVVEQHKQPPSSSSSSSSLAIMGMVTISQLIQYTIHHCNEQLFQTMMLQQQQQQSSQQHESPSQSSNGPDSSSQTITTTSTTITLQPPTLHIMKCLRHRINYLHVDCMGRDTALHASFVARSLHLDCFATTQEQISDLIRKVINDAAAVAATTSSSSSSKQHISNSSFDIAALSAIYVATELHLLSNATTPTTATDGSNSCSDTTKYEATWNFLEAQMIQWEYYCNNNAIGVNTTTSSWDTINNNFSRLLPTPSSILPQLLKIPSFVVSTAASAAVASAAAASSTSLQTTKLYQYHTPSDIAFTASVFGSAITSGIYSLFVPSSSTTTTVPVVPVAPPITTTQTTPPSTTTQTLQPVPQQQL